MVERLKKEICDLYLKIKRCSKDTTITESQYIKYLENSEDRHERKMIAQMDPFIVLQYISSSIDVIINLKFEDIEKKMMANNKDDNEEDLLNKIESVSLNSADIKKKNNKIENAEKSGKKKNVSKRDNIGYVDRLGNANTDR